VIDDGYKKSELGIVVICTVWRKGATETTKPPREWHIVSTMDLEKDYKELGDGVKLPRERPKRVEEKLYPVEIIERNEERVKVHYIGYNSSYDEWKEDGELEVYGGGFQLESCTFQPVFRTAIPDQTCLEQCQ